MEAWLSAQCHNLVSCSTRIRLMLLLCFMVLLSSSPLVSSDCQTLPDIASRNNGFAVISSILFSSSVKRYNDSFVTLRVGQFVFGDTVYRGDVCSVDCTQTLYSRPDVFNHMTDFLHVFTGPADCLFEIVSVLHLDWTGAC